MAGRERLAGLRAAGCCLALAVVFPAAHVPSPSQVRSAVNMVAARKAALARANAKVTALAKVLTVLETRAETLTERYDQAMWSERQASAAYDVAAARLAAARRTQRADAGKLGALAAADLEASGGQGQMALMFGGAGGPGAYLNAVGMAEVLAENRVDLIAASQADSAVAGVFAGQAAGLLAQRRADLAAAASLKKAVQSAVAAQLAAVAAARAHRGQLKAQLAAATRAEATLEAEASAAAAPAPVVTEAGGGAAQSWSGGWSAGGAASAAQGVTAVNWALTQIGKPYQWGGAGPGTYDCSGLAMDAWARAGIQLAHWTGYQWLSGPHVPINQLRPGDLVFFATNTADPATIHHVGIYVGQGLMVDAPYTGVDVRIDSIYSVGGLIGATRPAA